MNIYSFNENDEFLIELRKWCKNNPLTEKDYGSNAKFRLFQIEEARKGALLRNYTTIKCSVCGKESNVGNYKRWHEGNCGKVTYHSEETKRKISDTLKGREFSNEHRKKLSEANKRRKGIKFKKKTHSSSSS